MECTSREVITLCCLDEQKDTLPEHTLNELPQDIILCILEFIEIAISDEKTYPIHILFGYFSNDDHRIIDVIFKCICIDDCSNIAMKLINNLPMTRKVISLNIQGKQMPQVISLAYPTSSKLSPCTAELSMRVKDIQSLTMQNCKYAPCLTEAIISNAHNLRHMTLINPSCRLSREDFIRIFSNTDLISLTLEQKSIDDEMLSKAMNHNRRLKSLILQGYFIDLNSINGSNTKNLIFPPSLKVLSIGYRSLYDPRNLNWSFGPNLRKLCVSGITICKSFADMAKKNTKLNSLRLHMCDLNDNEAFSSLMLSFRELVYLDISWSKLYDIENVKTLCKLPRLKELDCCYCRMNNDVARPLLKSNNVHVLKMEENRITDGIMSDIMSSKIPDLRISFTQSDGRKVFLRNEGVKRGIGCNSTA